MLIQGSDGAPQRSRANRSKKIVSFGDRRGHVLFPMRIPACQSALFPLSFPFADREGPARRPSSLPAPAGTGSVANGSWPSPDPPRPAALPGIRERPSAPESFFCQGQNNSLLPLATQYSARQGQNGPSVPLAKQKSSCRGRKYPSVPPGILGVADTRQVERSEVGISRPTRSRVFAAANTERDLSGAGGQRGLKDP